jgi:hypothetical protein
VSLEILDALIRTCHKDLNLFCKHTVTIILDILQTNKPELVERGATSVRALLLYNKSDVS